ncbi:Pentatricopeptide repeat superfamily protein, putative [Theobroma cacao]|uniref:Pentatricopeptide repeat superfamily protein, putative n=1 Tax=Theobroma cacao TaxID=3641 RepID=A0A061F6E7_THECC|nr:Pentatricopeptide repeat superfamily protein, putative [Theobroma cacao]
MLVPSLDFRCFSLRKHSLFIKFPRRSLLASFQLVSCFTTLVATNEINPIFYPPLKVTPFKEKVKLDRTKRLKLYSKILHDCASKGSLRLAKVVHGKIMENGLDPDLHLWNSLVNVYAKCGSFGYACKVLDKMPETDVVSWTALFSGLVNEGHGSAVLGLYCFMKKDGVRPNGHCLVTALKACSLSLDLFFGTLLHGEGVKVGVLLDVFVGSSLVDLYAKCGEMELAERVFVYMDKKNVVSWNALLNGYALEGDAGKVLNLFEGMTESELRCSKFTLSNVLKSCTYLGNLTWGLIAHSVVIKSGCEHDEFVGCCLLDMYSKCGLAEDALKVFQRIQEPNIVAWSAMIDCLDEQGQIQEAAEMFCLMRRKGVSPNQHTFSSIAGAATNLGDQFFCEGIHACIIKYGFESENVLSNALISMYMKIRSVQNGWQVFKEMSSWDLASWNALLSGPHDDKTCDQGPIIFHKMLAAGFRPDICTFASILRSCSSLLNLKFGQQVHAHIIKNGLNGNNLVGTSLIDLYAKNRFLEDAELLFSQLIERDLFSWTALIAGYAQTNRVEKAIKCFNQIQRQGVKPNEFILATCLSSCSKMAMLENGQLLHSMAIKAGHSADLFVSSALVDMYANCGCIEEAESAFQGMASADVVSWNTMLFGYLQHGQGLKVLETFRTMLDKGLEPDEVTFIGVLSACSYMGLVEEGKEHFDSLTNVYGIVPTIEHYACMIDILGRAGKFNEVESFVKDTKVTSTALIWETVLGSCRMHGNDKFGEIAAEKLFELDPETASHYILLANIFAAKCRWDDVRRVRALMTSHGVKKEPGCSWVMVNGQLHIFRSADSSHPMNREIYMKLQELVQKVILAGYVPKTEHVLHNVSHREKMEQLFCHNERLALAFALISINPMKTVRIFKNLLICEDCHDFMKLVSGIIEQEIVVRDVNCFHHFRSGICSCQDRWVVLPNVLLLKNTYFLFSFMDINLPHLSPILSELQPPGPLSPGFSQNLQVAYDVESSLSEHLRIWRHLRIISYQYHVFKSRLLILVTGSQITSLLITAKANVNGASNGPDFGERPALASD